MTILIPSYEPDEKLLLLIERLQAAGNRSIVLVDDGSGERYSGIFNQARRAGCTVLTHRSNQGKGSALKTGFRHIRASGDTSGIVCADSDGQHLPKDIAAVGEALRRNPGHIVLGSRHFVGKVPFRSRLGNAATRLVYRFATGVSVRDTQTGLRGYSPDMLDWLCRLSGERFEYEMIMLLEAKQAGYPLIELPIETVYLNGNESSHFRPLADSARVYLPFLKFVAVSGLSAVLDFLLLLLLHLITGSLLLSVIGARVGSSAFNFGVNRHFVFARSKPLPARKALPRYYALASSIVIMNYLLLFVLHDRLSVPLAAAKLLTEAMLFLFSYSAQRKFVYPSD